MSFPLDYHGKIAWHSQTGLSSEQFQQHFVTRMAAALEDSKGTTTVIGNKVSFTGTLFSSVSKGSILVFITKGYIEVKPGSDNLVVSYYLNFKQLFVLTSFLVLFAFGFNAFADYSASLAERVGIPVFAWFCLFGMNILVIRIRFPAFIKQVLMNVSH